MLSVFKILLPVLAAAAVLWAAGVCVWRTLRPGAPALLNDWAPPQQVKRIALLCLLAGVAWQAVFWVQALVLSPGTAPIEAIQRLFFGNSDAKHYLDLAQYGYGNGEAFPEQYLMIVFFPLYPALLRLLNPFGIFNPYLLSLVVQIPLFCIAGTNLYKLAYRHWGARTAQWCVVFLLATPGSVFFFAPMTESLFLALATGYVLCLEKQRWWMCGLLGVLVGLTRAPGGLLAGLAVVYLLENALRSKTCPKPQAAVAVCGPVLGIGMYFLLNLRIYGNWKQYSIYQREHWHNALGLFTDTLQYQLDYLAGWWQTQRASAVYICLGAILCILVGAALMALAAKKLPTHYLAYALAYFVVTLGVTWLISAPRYMAALFCLPMMLALVARKERYRWAVLGVLATCNVAYSLEFLWQGPVY